jgi:hypothetical protein
MEPGQVGTEVTAGQGTAGSYCILIRVSTATKQVKFTETRRTTETPLVGLLVLLHGLQTPSLSLPSSSQNQPISSVLMQSLSRLSYLPASLTRNNKLNTAASLTRSDPSDPSLSADSTLHLHRAPLAQIDQQLFTHSAADIISPTPLSHTEAVPSSRGIGKPIMPRRASYTNEDNLYSMVIGNNSSQSSLPAHRRLSQCVFV